MRVQSKASCLLNSKWTGEERDCKVNNFLAHELNDTKQSETRQFFSLTGTLEILKEIKMKWNDSLLQSWRWWFTDSFRHKMSFTHKRKKRSKEWRIHYFLWITPWFTCPSCPIVGGVEGYVEGFHFLLLEEKIERMSRKKSMFFQDSCHSLLVSLFPLLLLDSHTST